MDLRTISQSEIEVEQVPAQTGPIDLRTVNPSDVQVLDLRAINPADIEVAPAPAPSDDGAIVRSFKAGIGALPGGFGAGVEAYGRTLGWDWLTRAGQGLSEMAAAPPAQAPLRPSDALTGIGPALTFAGEQLGQGVASTLPSIASGAIGAGVGALAAGPVGVIPGTVAGVAASAVPLNTGDLMTALVEEGVDPDVAGKIATVGGAIISVPDVASGQFLTRGLTGPARQALNRGIAKRIAAELGKGASIEGVTEGLQQIIQETIVGVASGKPDIARRAENVVTAATAGAMAGGMFGGPAGIRKPRGPDVEPPPTEAPPPPPAEALAKLPAPGSAVGLAMAEGQPPQRVTVKGYEADGRVAAVEFDDGVVNLVPTDQFTTVAAPPETRPEPAPSTARGIPLTREEAFSIEDAAAKAEAEGRLKPADEKRLGRAPAAPAPSIPGIIEAGDAVAEADRLERIAVDTPSSKISDNARADLLARAAELRRQNAAPSGGLAPLAVTEPVQPPAPAEEATPTPEQAPAAAPVPAAEPLGEAPPSPAISPEPPAKRRGFKAAQKKPLDLAQFLASRGGIRDEGGELRSRDLHREGLVPGYGALVRPGGMGLLEAAELAWQYGYFDRRDQYAASIGSGAPTRQELIELLERQNRGERIYSEQGRAIVEEANAARIERDTERNAKKHIPEARQAAAELGVSLTDEQIADVARTIAQQDAIGQESDPHKIIDYMIDNLERQAIESEPELLGDRAQETVDATLSLTEHINLWNEVENGSQPGDFEAANEAGARDQETERPAPGIEQPEPRQVGPNDGGRTGEDPGGGEPPVRQGNEPPTKAQQRGPDLLSEATDQGENLPLPGMAKADPENILRQIEGAALRHETDRQRGERGKLAAHRQTMRDLATEYRRRSGLSPEEASKRVNAAAISGTRKAVEVTPNERLRGQRESFDETPLAGGKPKQGTLLQKPSTAPTAAAPVESSARIAGDAQGINYGGEQAKQARARVETAMRDIAATVLGPDVDVRVFDELWITADGTHWSEPSGGYVPGERIIAVSMRSLDPARTLNHEAIHWLRAAGLISDKDWSILSQQTPAWREAFDIDKHYAGAAESVKTEEAIAEAFGAWQTGAMRVDGAVARVFNAIQQFFDRVANAIHGLGYRSWQDVFAAIGRGDLAGRIATNDGTGLTVYRMTDHPEGRGVVVHDVRDPTATWEFSSRDRAERFARGAHDMERAVQEIQGAADAVLDENAAEGVRGRTMMQVAGKANATLAPRKPGLATISKASALVMFPRGLASIDTLSSRYWQAWRNKSHDRHRLEAKYARMSAGYHDATPQERRNVNRAEEIARLTGQIVRDTGRRVVVKNENLAEAEFSKPGEYVFLTDAETRVFFERQRLFKAVWSDIRDATLRAMGYDGEATVEGIRAKIDAAEKPKQRDYFEKILEVHQALEGQRRGGYVPFVRHGNYYIAVTKPSEDGGMAETVRFEMLETDRSMQIRNRVLPTTPAEAVKRIAELRAKYPESAGYDIRSDWVLPKMPDDLSLPMIDRLMAAVGAEDETLRDGIVKELLKRTRAELKADLKKRSRNVPGYSTDFDRATVEYLRNAASNVAGLLHKREIDAAYDGVYDDKGKLVTRGVSQHPDANVQNFWKQYKDYMENPGSDFALLRKFGFFQMLAFNFASAGVNLSQSVLVTPFNLGMWAGHGRAQIAVAKAFAEATAALRITKDPTRRGITIDIDALGKTPAEKAMLRKFAEDGRLQAQLTQEWEGLNAANDPALRPAASVLQRVFDVGASAFASAEIINRATAALAAFRLAQNPEATTKARQVYAENAVFAELVKQAGGVTPEMLAGFMVDETQFVAGKENRPWVGRKGGAALLQFKTFSMMYLGTLGRLWGRTGPEGKKAAAMMVGALWLFGGLWAFPFGEDLRDLLEWLSKKFLKYDIDIDRELTEIMTAVVSPGVAEAVLHGVSRAATGTDLGKRIGQGSLLPTAELGDTLGVPWAVTGRRIDEASERLATGQYGEGWLSYLMAAGDAASPQALRNVWQAARWTDQGVRTVAGNKVMQPEDISTLDVIRKVAGFNPASVARAQEKRYGASRIATGDAAAKTAAYTRLAGIWDQKLRAAKDKDTAEVSRLNREFYALLKEYRDAGMPLDSESIKRAIKRQIAPEQSMIERAPKAKRGEVREYLENAP